MENKILMKISGTTCEGEPFKVVAEFTLIPPKEGEPHYGTGCYMTVKLPGDKHLVDVRYEKTTDLEVLANRWIQGYFGKNAHKVTRQN